MSGEGQSPSAQAERDALEAAKGILLDWDGCLAVNNRIVPAAARLIGRHADRMAIISNNSSHLPADFAAILEKNGSPLPEERIFTAGVEAVHAAMASGAERVLMLSSTKMRHYALDQGMPLVREDPDMVLLMRDTRFNYAKLERAANALKDGAKLLVANSDRTHPGPGGQLVPETGALLAAVLSCLGDKTPEPDIIGKPGPLLFERACHQLDIAPGEAVMIGDNPETDGKGAQSAGIRPILIGPHSPITLQDLLEPIPVD